MNGYPAGPADIFLGKDADLATAYGFQAASAAGLLAAGRLVTLLARRKRVIHGG